MLQFTELIDQLTPQRQQGGPATAGSSMPGMKATGVGKGAVPKGSKSRGAQDEDSWLKDTNVHVTKVGLSQKLTSYTCMKDSGQMIIWKLTRFMNYYTPSSGTID